MTGEVWDQIHDLWFTRVVVLPPGHGGFKCFRWYCLNVMTYFIIFNMNKVRILCNCYVMHYFGK